MEIKKNKKKMRLVEKGKKQSKIKINIKIGFKSNYFHNYSYL